MNLKIFLVSTLFTAISVAGCQQNYEAPDKFEAERYHRSNKLLNKVVVKDIFSPPVASRIFVYPNIAAYEAIVHKSDKYRSLVGQLNGLTSLPSPDTSKQYHWELAAIEAFHKTAITYVDSRKDIEKARKRHAQKIKSQLPESVYKRSIAFGQAISESIIQWSKEDGYRETRNMTGYHFSDTPGSWKATPPVYRQPVEPNWSHLRPLVMDSSSQFLTKPPVEFDTAKGSEFYRQAKVVYNANNNAIKNDDEKVLIAKFWNCLPDEIDHRGHQMIHEKNMSPGGHWLMLTSDLCQVEDMNLMASTHAMAKVSIALYESFLSSWDSKYHYNLIRPITYIREYIDPSWGTVLQTPAFPEYPSAHSEVSAASASVLSTIFGDNYTYVDSTEIPYGLPTRKFQSFDSAASEAAKSRLYGGIHYPMAAKSGTVQGYNIGKYVLKKIKMRNGKSGLATKQ